MSTFLIKHSTLVTGFLSLLSLGSLVLTHPSNAATINSIDLDFTNWETFGDVVTHPNQAQLTNAFSSGFDDLDNLGNPQNFNVSGNDPIFAFDLEFELGLADGSLGFDSGETSAIKRTFTVQSGEVLRFKWNFLTNHNTASNRNDYAFVAIDSSIVRLADTNSSLSSPGKNGFSQQTGFKTFSHTFTTSGEFTIAIGVTDVVDDTTTSALTVEPVPIPEPLTILGSVTALGFGTLLKREYSKKRQN